MVKKIVISCGIAFVTLVANATLNPNDSVKVVKGQVSDYYITVAHERTLKGHVLDKNHRPLEGATVMFFASPMHSTTAQDGSFAIKGSDNDVHLYVYYPGKKIVNRILDLKENDLNVLMESESRNSSLLHQPAQITQWYNPQKPISQTYCNPMNISYNFEPYNNNVLLNGSFRSAADPMAVVYKGEYFLFSTNQGGFHYSKDLVNWDFVPASFQRKPTDDDLCAPAAYVSGDTLFYTGSTYEGLAVWYSTNPKFGRFKRALEKNVLPSWDPCLFLDDDGKLYLYYGSSNEYPLKGVELDRNDFYPISKIHDIMMLRPEEHGWERFGMNNDDEVTLRPFTEGAYMTKYGNKYYFQYGAPGTEFKVYADGVYVSDSPLGPFIYQKHNPMCYKPGGYVQGAGHGGTFCDVKGNYWHVATCMLSLKYKFERRIGLYPVAFDKDSIMYSSTAFGDYPNWAEPLDIKKPAERFTGWMLLSYQKPVDVSSTDSIYVAANLTDENMRTYWAAQSGNPGEWIKMDLGSVKTVRALQLNFYDHKAIQYNRAMDIYHQYRIYASDNGKDWILVIDKSDSDKDCPHDYVELKEPLRTRFLRYENVHMPTGNVALSDFRVFGNGDGTAPQKVKGLTINRDKKDRRNAFFSWRPNADAYGYNIYYGTAPDKMYNAITVLGQTKYDFRGLDKNTDYYFAVEAMNENGRSLLCEIQKH